MDKAEVQADAGLRTAWQAESVYIQWMAFSLVLVTLALTFQHLSRTKTITVQRKLAVGLSLTMATVSLSFGVVALCVYTKRMSLLKLETSTESYAHIAILCIGTVLLLCEGAFIVGMMLTAGKKPPT